MRHGETEWNASRRAQGQADVALNELGRLQAREAAAHFESVDLTAVYSSDLERAYDTALPIARAHGLEVHSDPAFREIDQGDWEGLSNAEIARRWPELWGPARHWSQRPGGEAPEQVLKRALEGLARIVERHPRGAVVIVSHGGTIRWISAHALGHDIESSARIRGVANGGAVALDARLDDGALRLENFERFDRAATDIEDPNA